MILKINSTRGHTGSLLVAHMTGTVNTNHPLSAVQFVFLAG